VAVLAAAATIVDKDESLRWLWVALIVAGAVGSVPLAILSSPWWQQRQTANRERAEVAARRARDQRYHFDPRGRGVLPFGERQGFYFTGRTRALQELAGWLAAVEGQPPVRVVTGTPGSGKSAVLGRLVMLADPGRREAALQAAPDLDPAVLPPPGSIALSVHARERTAQEIIKAIAAAIGVEVATVEDLMEILETQPRPLNMVVDAVDEAVAAEQVAGVLARLAATGRIRLLVGCRRHLVDRLVAPEHALDLDDPAYLNAEDVLTYVRRCLLLDGDPDAPTPYRGREALAHQVAAAVAARAGGNFLVAQLVSLSLVNAGQPLDVTAHGWQKFPRKVSEAMLAYLDGFGSHRARVRDLLLPLAFAEGEGLANQAVWAVLASELGTGHYGAQDVRWLLRDTTAANLLQSTELDEGQVAWRLFHQALAEYLRSSEADTPAQEVQRRITTVLVDQVPTREEQRDWLAAERYTRAYLPVHAAAAGQLDEFAADPGVLLAAEPARLLEVLGQVNTPAGWTAARVYQQAAHQLTADRPLGERASCCSVPPAIAAPRIWLSRSNGSGSICLGRPGGRTGRQLGSPGSSPAIPGASMRWRSARSTASR
jgi:hypothetical protein